MNNWTIAGRLGRDAETRATQNGNTVTNFSVAVDEYAGGGERKTLWVSCSWWGDRGEKLQEYLTKGKAVSVSGQAGVRTYDGRDGTKAEMTLRVLDLTMLGGDSGGDTQRTGDRRQAAPAAQQARTTPPAQRQAPPPDDFEDDIPF